MVVRQRGDAEGALSFDPENKAQVKIALKLAGVRPKRKVIMTPERLAALANARNSRSIPCVERAVSELETLECTRTQT